MNTQASSMQLYQLLKSLHKFDKLEFKKLHLTTCPRCSSGRLHSACYYRKLRGFGLDDCSVEEFSLRFSLCCSSCRRRTSPVSSLFAGRFVYSTLVLLAVLLWPRRFRRLSYPAGITKRRWRQWWRESPSVESWAMRARAVTCGADLSLRELVLALKKRPDSQPRRERVLTFHPEILWAYCSRRG